MRVINAIDFWRGVSLVMIYVNHVPGNVLGELTLRNFGLIDAADVFVFLAGWALFHATGGHDRPESWQRVCFRLLMRAIQIYRAHIVVSVLGLAILAAVALSRSNPIYLEWNGASPAFADPARALIGLVLLGYQIGYFNILPLYVVLLLLAPPLVLLARWRPGVALAVSLTIYVVVLWTRLIPPAWPAYERWYFNPFAWQVLIVLGYIAASRASDTRFRAVVRRLVPWSVLVLIAALVVTRLQLFPDPLLVPEPRMFFIFDKTYLTPARLVNLLALVIAFHDVFRYFSSYARAIAEYLCSLGRNSLAVFGVGSLLSLVGQIIHFDNRGSLAVDVGIVVTGLGVMGLTAWFVEWRDRLPAELASQRSSH